MSRRQRNDRSRGRLVCALACLLGVGLALGANGGGNVVNGRVADVYDLPVEGYRVVFRPAASDEVVFSEPTEANGEYVVLLAPDVAYIPFALISATGKRIELAPTPPQTIGPGERVDIQLDFEVPLEPLRVPQMFRGSDRLFLSFAEDTVYTDRVRIEGQLDFANYPSADTAVSRVIAAFHTPGIPDTEFGARIGYGAIDTPFGTPDRTGISDLDLWARLTLPSSSANRPDFAFGGIVTLPLSDSGLGFDATRSKLFGAARFQFAGSVLSVHAGVRFNESGTLGGVGFDGEVAAALGVAYIRPLSWDGKTTLIAEATYEGERFTGGDPDSRLLAGLNWKVVEHGAIRVAAATGLTDGAPDLQVLAGYTFDF